MTALFKRYNIRILMCIVIIIFSHNLSLGVEPESTMVLHKSKFGFEIKYYKNWRVETGGHHTTTISSYSAEKSNYNPGLPVPANEIKIEIQIKDNVKLTLDDYVSSYENIIRSEDIKINGVVAKKILYKIKDPYEWEHLEVIYIHNKKFVNFNCYPSDTKYFKELDIIVKSFKFTK